jgi:hypothetical protein
LKEEKLWEGVGMKREKGQEEEYYTLIDTSTEPGKREVFATVWTLVSLQIHVETSSPVN